jgi:hypothetical protein
VSARPDVPRLSEEDLDLLISRSLDGDLSPEEEQRLERIVALDPAAARRKAELAALVAEVKALPEPAAPFAIATRVNSNVAERAGRPGSLGGRVGFFPAPGSGKVALVVLFIVGVAVAVLRPAPKPRAEGPVDVVLYSAPAANSAPERDATAALRSPRPADAEAEKARKPDSVVAQAAGRELKRQEPFEEKARAKETDERGADSNERQANLSDKLSKTEVGAKKEEAGKSLHAAPEPASVVAESAADRREKNLEGAPKQKAASASGARNDLDGQFAQAPAKVTGGLVVAPAPAAPPAEAGAASSRLARGWTVSVRGDAARRWALRRAPDRSPTATAQPVVYRVVVDASGRVASARLVGRAAVEPALDEFVRGMVFESVPDNAPASRDQKDAPASPTNEFEIELAPR